MQRDYIKGDYLALLHAYRAEHEDIDLIIEQMNRIAAYQHHVWEMTMMEPVLRIKYEGQEFRDRFKEIDTTRTNKHEAAIIGTAILTRMAHAKNIQPMFRGDVTNRYDVAEFAGNVADVFYRDGQSKP